MQYLDTNLYNTYGFVVYVLCSEEQEKLKNFFYYFSKLNQIFRYVATGMLYKKTGSSFAYKRLHHIVPISIWAVYIISLHII